MGNQRKASQDDRFRDQEAHKEACRFKIASFCIEPGECGGAPFRILVWLFDAAAPPVVSPDQKPSKQINTQLQPKVVLDELLQHHVHPSGPVCEVPYVWMAWLQSWLDGWPASCPEFPPQPPDMIIHMALLPRLESHCHCVEDASKWGQGQKHLKWQGLALLLLSGPPPLVCRWCCWWWSLHFKQIKNVDFFDCAAMKVWCQGKWLRWLFI